MVVHDETIFLNARVLIGLCLGPLYDTQCTGSTAGLIVRLCLCQAAKRRGGSLPLQINNNDHPGPHYHHGTILPCSHVALMIV